MMKDYSLIVIEQEKIPLAAGPDMTYNLFWMALAVLLAVTVVVCVWGYLKRCLDYRKRIRELDPGGGVYLGWNIWRLELTVEELALAMTGIL